MNSRELTNTAQFKRSGTRAKCGKYAPLLTPPVVVNLQLMNGEVAV